MNSTLQCLSATFPLARFFRGLCRIKESFGDASHANIWLTIDGSFKRAINTVNPLGTKGDLAKAFATLVSMLWEESYTFLSPVTFRVSVFANNWVSTAWLTHIVLLEIDRHFRTLVRRDRATRFAGIPQLPARRFA